MLPKGLQVDGALCAKPLAQHFVNSRALHTFFLLNGIGLFPFPCSHLSSTFPTMHCAWELIFNGSISGSLVLHFWLSSAIGRQQQEMEGSEKATQVSHLVSSTEFTAPLRQPYPVTAPPCAPSNLEVGIRLFSHITNNLKISVALGANIWFSAPQLCRLVLVLLGSADLSPGCKLGSDLLHESPLSEAIRLLEHILFMANHRGTRG